MKNIKNSLLFGILAIAGIFLFSCNQEPKEDETTQNTDTLKHYRHILFAETAYDDVKGTYELSTEEAKNINNYKFVYDNKNRPVSIEFNRGGILLGYGELDAAKVAIEYTDSTETRLFFDKDNNPTEVNGKVFKYVFSLNKEGLRTGLKFFDKDGKLMENRNKIAYYTWSKLPDGMIKENRYNLKSEEVVMNEFCPFYELRFSYNEKGFVSRMANYQADTLYNCTAENCGDIGVSYFLFDISEKGDLLKFTVHNTTGRLANLYWGWAKFENKYDSVGNPIEVAYWDQDDEFLKGKKIPVYQYKYDAHGSVSEISFMDHKRNIINHPERKFAIMEFKYNEQGQPTDTLKYDNKRVQL